MGSSATQTVPDPSKSNPLLTVRQLAECEGLTESQVRVLIDRHGLPCYRAFGSVRGPRGIRIRWSEYLTWLEGRR